MIPRADITAWRSVAPWKLDSQVEQDLILSRSLVGLFSNDRLAKQLAFRGGTVLHKLYLSPPSRYSEDIDLVQIEPAPIDNVIDSIRNVLDPLLGKPQIKQNQGSQSLIYRMASEIPPIVPMRLKVEINSREHFNVFGLIKKDYEVKSRWHSMTGKITTYSIDELMGTKLRALYQRRKGRDLFDLWLTLTKGNASPVKIVEAFRKYLNHSGLSISKDEFKKNSRQRWKTMIFCMTRMPYLDQT